MMFRREIPSHGARIGGLNESAWRPRNVFVSVFNASWTFGTNDVQTRDSVAWRTHWRIE